MSFENRFYDINLRCHGDEWNQVQKLAQDADKEIIKLLTAVGALTRAYSDWPMNVSDEDEDTIGKLLSEYGI